MECLFGILCVLGGSCPVDDIGVLQARIFVRSVLAGGGVVGAAAVVVVGLFGVTAALKAKLAVAMPE
eukprot:9572217-Ditylum_brightwellii.AAC.1